MHNLLYKILRKVYRMFFLRYMVNLFCGKNEIYSQKNFQEKQSNKLCIFSSYDSEGIIHDYVLYYLQELKKIDTDIIFVTTSPTLEEKEIEKIRPFVSSYIHRKNVGYDFGSWKTALDSINYMEYEQIIFTNDSVYGPLFPLQSVFDDMKSRDYDVWGITDSYEIRYHLMSYFVVYNRSIIKNPLFAELWNSILFYKNEHKQRIIEEYEIGFSRKLYKSSYKIGAYCDYWTLIDKLVSKEDRLVNDLKISFRGLNPTLHLWRQGIEYKMLPFLKKEIPEQNRLGSVLFDIFSLLKKYTQYDIENIKKYMKR